MRCADAVGARARVDSGPAMVAGQAGSGAVCAAPPSSMAGTGSRSSIPICMGSCPTPASMSKARSGRPEAAPSSLPSRSSPACCAAASSRSSSAPTAKARDRLPRRQRPSRRSWRAPRHPRGRPRQGLGYPRRAALAGAGAVLPPALSTHPQDRHLGEPHRHLRRRTDLLPAPRAGWAGEDNAPLRHRRRHGQRGHATRSGVLFDVPPDGRHRIHRFGILGNGSRSRTLGRARLKPSVASGGASRKGRGERRGRAWRQARRGAGERDRARDLPSLRRCVAIRPRYPAAG